MIGNLWKRQLRPAVTVTLVTMLVTGLIYPAMVTVCARFLFPRQAGGSLLARDGRIVGSALIGQSFSQPQYFHPRPSAAGAGYDATATGGTNKGPTDRKLADTLIAQAVERVAAVDHVRRGSIPSDMVTSSGSGLDPDISPANATLQIARVAARRGLPDARVRALVARLTQQRQFGVLGEPRVNVLQLNLALDSLR